MSDFNPGPGWREAALIEDSQHGETEQITWARKGGPVRKWFRVSPVPPLPTALNSVIRAHWSADLHTDLWLTELGWVSRLGSVYGQADITQLVEFEILAAAKEASDE